MDPVEVEKFCRDVLKYAPIVAAANFFSNLIHAHHSDQLADICPSTDLKLPEGHSQEGQLSWLAHAQSHLDAYWEFRSRLEPAAKL